MLHLLYILIPAYLATEEIFEEIRCLATSCLATSCLYEPNWSTTEKISRATTPQTRSSTPEAGSYVTIKPVKIFGIPDFLPPEAEFAKAPNIIEQTITLEKPLGKGSYGKGFRLSGNKDIFIKIFKDTKVSKIEQLYQEFKTQYVASVLAWVYSSNPKNKLKIAYLIPSLITIDRKENNGKIRRFYGFAMRFLPTFQDSKTDFLEINLLDQWIKFSDWVNEKSDLCIWDDQGYYKDLEEGYCYMVDAQIHPDCRIIDKGEKNISEKLENPEIQKIVLDEAFRCLTEEVQKKNLKSDN